MSEIEFNKLAREMASKQSSGSSVLLLSIVTLIAVLLMWASVTELDRVTRGAGKTTSELQNQLVQSSEPGVIKSRYVNEGDFVKKGQLLFDIDPVDAKTALDQAKKRQSSLKIKAIRLQAEVNGEIPEYSDNLIETSPASVTTELALFRARLDDLNTKSAILEQRRLQKLNEIEELRIQYIAAENGLALIRREIATVEPLVKTGLAPETRLIALKREEEAALGQANYAASGEKRIESGLIELTEQLKAEEQAYVTSALTDLSSIEAEMAELEARIPALEDRVERTSVKSPIDGVINRLNYVTADAYIKTGDVLLEIVPSGTDLIVEARIDPKDIAEVVAGQDVMISLSAYDPTRYGRIEGIVKSVSADAISDPQTGQQHYLVDVEMKSTLYEDDGTAVSVLPGMIATIDVLSGKRTVIDYFWKPLARMKETAFRE